jgi:levanase/fructan beta-fructosidase
MTNNKALTLAAVLAAGLVFLAPRATAAAKELSVSAVVEMTIEKRYLNFPVSHDVERQPMTFKIGNAPAEAPVVIRLAHAGVDYWVFRDMEAHRGKKVTINYDGDPAALRRVYLSDEIAGADSLGSETNRPRFHFTPRRGWNNDPNGLLFRNGEYHLYYQHNPYERDWENMHWGHAVSRDLVHWQELDEALRPDALGTMFSGSAVVDTRNTSGFGKKGVAPIVAIYTAASADRQTQCIAWSLDGGRTFTKYAGNPVIDSKERWNSVDTRDPKVFWYTDKSDDGWWVMVLNERDGHSIYTSPDLKKWQYRSHTTGFWECPELFPLAVDGDPSRTLWVMYGASGTYMLGDFNGVEFTPRHGKYLYTRGTMYAAQTFSGMTDGRRVQMGWGRVSHPGMAFNGMMTLPTELTLRTTKDGPRLFSEPVKEVRDLFSPVARVAGLNKGGDKGAGLNTDEANALLSRVRPDDGLRIETTIKLSHATSAGIDIDGQRILDYDMNGNTVNGTFYSPDDPTSMSLTAEIFIDRTSIEVFIDGGAFSYSMERTPAANRKTDRDNRGLRFWGNRVDVTNLAVHSLAPLVSTTPEVPDGMYANPVMSQNMPDPTVIRDSEGTFWMYATEDIRNVPIFCSRDMVTWQFAGTAFSNDTRPRFEPRGGIWAPDINFIDGRWVLYYSMSVWGGEQTCGIGVATADHLAGPFTDHGPMFRSGDIGVRNSIDQFYIDDNGKKYMFWGSFSGIYAVELSDDGLSVRPGAQKQQIAGRAFEGVYIHRRNGYYYMFASVGSCCEGLNSTYRLVVTRSKSLLGPYESRAGVAALDNGHDVVVGSNNRFVGNGHCSEIVSDDAGVDWIFFHGFDASLEHPTRQPLLERVDWVDGWPVIGNGSPGSTAPKPTITRP